MSHMVIGGQNDKAAIVALWNPSPDRRDADSDFLQRKRISPGCVGYFNSSGGFHVLFNVLRTKKQNEDLGYKVPPGYKQFAKVMSLSLAHDELLTSELCRIIVSGRRRCPNEQDISTDSATSQ